MSFTCIQIRNVRFIILLYTTDMLYNNIIFFVLEFTFRKPIGITEYCCNTNSEYKKFKIVILMYMARIFINTSILY